MSLFFLIGCSKNQAAAVPQSLADATPPPPVTTSTIATPPPEPQVPAFNCTVREAHTLFAHAQMQGMPTNGIFMLIDTTAQKATVINSAGIQHEYLISSSKYGVGSQANSNKTPLGWHRVTERFGGDELHGTSFTARRPDGEILPPSEWRSQKPRDYVLTRILWLDGLEPGLNRGGSVDSHARFIYIHGTNQEHLLGQPASHGCIRLSNRDVMELFDITESRDLYCLIR